MKKILMLSVVLVSLLLISGCGEKKETNNNGNNGGKSPVVNTNEGVIKDQVVGEFKFVNTSLVYMNGVSTLRTEVTNTSKSTVHLKSFDIIVKDKDGKELAKMLGYIGEDVKAGESRTITSNADSDLSKATSITYTINK